MLRKTTKWQILSALAFPLRAYGQVDTKSNDAEYPSAKHHMAKAVQQARHDFRGKAEVRTYTRKVRAGGANVTVGIVVVRRKPHVLAPDHDPLGPRLQQLGRELGQLLR